MIGSIQPGSFMYGHVLPYSDEYVRLKWPPSRDTGRAEYADDDPLQNLIVELPPPPKP